MNIETSISRVDDSDVVVGRRPGPKPLAWLRRYRWFALVVLLPTALATIYYGLIASNVYVSESKFLIRSPGEKSVPVGGLASLIQTTGMSGGQEQTNAVLDYLRSRNALADLQKRINVEAKFATPEADYLSRYDPLFYSRGFETLYDYYGSMVTADLDNTTLNAVLTVRAFTPRDAHDINAQLLDLSEALVNRLNQRAEHKAIAEGERRVSEAETRVRNARVALGAFRNQKEIIDPAKEATGVFEISNQLIGERAALQAQLETMQRVAPANPSLPALRDHIGAIDRAIAAQNGRAVGTPTGIASKLAPYENLLVEQEFATETLTAASTALEQARTEAQKQQFYLERVVEPNTPDLPLLPKRIKQILTIAGAALCLYFVAWMFVVGILEHSPED